MKPHPKSTEKATQAAILQYLTLKGVFHYRQNSGAFKTDAGGFYAIGTKGAPDIICVVGGRYIGIEVKDAKGRLNENQIAFQKRLEAAGGLYLVAYSLDDVIPAGELKMLPKAA
jgi:hypothetical protein